MKAILRQVRISPKKANLVAQLVRGKTVTDALNILRFTPKKAAKIIGKVVKSASANAEENFNQTLENLYIKEIIVTEGTTYKRGVSISKGRVHPILKRTSHITVKVEALMPNTEVKDEDSKKEKVEDKTNKDTQEKQEKPTKSETKTKKSTELTDK